MIFSKPTPYSQSKSLLSAFFFSISFLFLAMMTLNCEKSESGCESKSSGCNTKGESVTITGKIQVGTTVNNTPEPAGTLLKGAEIFVAGSNEPVVTGDDGTFSLDVALSGSLNALDRRASAGDTVRLYAWKDYSKAENSEGLSGSLGQTKLGIAQSIELEDQDLGTIELLWTNAGHFRVLFPAGVDTDELDLDAINANSQITVDGIPLLGSAALYRRPNGNIRFDISYLPVNEDYTIHIWIDGYKDIDLEVNDWPENASESNGNWFLYPADISGAEDIQLEAEEH